MISRAVAAGRRFTGRMSADTRAGLSGLTWSYLSHGPQLVFRFGSSLILTRLLAPEDYGLFAMALPVLFFLEFLSDIGLRPIVLPTKLRQALRRRPAAAPAPSIFKAIVAGAVSRPPLSSPLPPCQQQA